MSTPVLTYAIDHDDRLVNVDDGYYRFAEANGWDGAGSSLGRTLWDFVAGEEMRKLQRMLLRRLRGEARRVKLPFRCDSPDVRREMDLRIVAHRSGRTVLFAAALRSEQRRSVPIPILDPTIAREGEELVMCGWCDRFLHDKEWVEIEIAAARLELFDRPLLPPVSHDICPTCSEMLLAA